MWIWSECDFAQRSCPRVPRLQVQHTHTSVADGKYEPIWHVRTGGWRCLIPTPYLQRQKYPHFFTAHMGCVHSCCKLKQRWTSSLPRQAGIHPTTTCRAPRSVWHQVNQEQIIPEISSLLLMPHGTFRLGPGAPDKWEPLCRLSSSRRIVGHYRRTFLAARKQSIGRQWLQRWGCIHFLPPFSFLKP